MFIFLFNVYVYIFLIVCFVGSFGYDCQERCSIYCVVLDRCDRVIGECEDGCLVGWKGVMCDKCKKYVYCCKIYMN